MAEVYLAHDQLLDRPVALKVLFPEFARDPSFVERFRREAQAAANLNHPNIVAIYDWGQEHGTYFIVMEYVEGRSLRDLIRAEGPLDPSQAADDRAPTSPPALAFAHRNGVVHRDVKPGNVLITTSGQVKVTDFGIARASGTSDGLTQTGSVMGTATYFSPEQAQGLAVDGRSDVYSLGVVLYEMVTGVAAVHRRLTRSRSRTSTCARSRSPPSAAQRRRPARRSRDHPHRAGEGPDRPLPVAPTTCAPTSCASGAAGRWSAAPVTAMVTDGAGPAVGRGRRRSHAGRRRPDAGRPSRRAGGPVIAVVVAPRRADRRVGWSADHASSATTTSGGNVDRRGAERRRPARATAARRRSRPRGSR